LTHLLRWEKETVDPIDEVGGDHRLTCLVKRAGKYRMTHILRCQVGDENRLTKLVRWDKKMV
jgi:hypothetical protein